jgi:hypothetical protein
MTAAGDYFVYFVIAVSGGENVIFLAHTLETEARFVKTARGCSAYILAYQRIKPIAGKGFLRKQDFTARAPLDSPKYFKIFYKPLLVDYIAGSFQPRIFGKSFFNAFYDIGFHNICHIFNL